VVTESGEQLGRVLGFSFDIETGELTTLVMGRFGVPLLGEGVLSTWELPVIEIVSSGTDRIIVYEGAEEKLRQLGTGILEKLGIGGSSWEQEERARFGGSMVPAENQLPAGQPSAVEPPAPSRPKASSTTSNWKSAGSASRCAAAATSTTTSSRDGAAGRASSVKTSTKRRPTGTSACPRSRSEASGSRSNCARGAARNAPRSPVLPNPAPVNN
jgi:sporulation protein YlmC with PRC-barrel domain